MSDEDDDGYGDASPPSGVTAGSDCNDSRAHIYPGAPDARPYDYVDENCDGIVGVPVVFHTVVGTKASINGSEFRAGPIETVIPRDGLFTIQIQLPDGTVLKPYVVEVLGRTQVVHIDLLETTGRVR